MGCSCENGKTAEDENQEYTLNSAVSDISKEESSDSNTINREEDVDAVINQKNKEIAQLKDQILRSRADFDNFRKRCIKTEEQNRRLSVKEIAIDIISINDNIIRACDAALHIKDGETVESSHNSFVEGVQLISKSIEQTLSKNGIEEIDALNCLFNPMIHEAIEFDSSESVQEDTVTKVHQKGFRIDNLVIRTAKVKVTKPLKKDTVKAASPEADSSN